MFNSVRRFLTSKLHGLLKTVEESKGSNTELDRGLLDTKVKEGWRQGTVLSKASSESICGNDIGRDSVLIVITQTCDLLHNSLEKEPVVELLVGEVRDGSVPGQAGKSFREFELELDCMDAQRFVYVTARPRIEVCRRKFLEQGIKHDYQPTSKILNWFSRWLGEKYSRPAFPNAFDQRLAACKNKITKAIKKVECCRGMYLSLSSWDELNDSDVYTVVLVLLLRHDATADDVQKSETAHTKICGLFESAGHRVNEEFSGVFRDDEMTMRDFQPLKKWSLDYISISNPAHGEPPVA